MKNTPNEIYGRMCEGLHLGGYVFQRAIEELRWLLEDDRYKCVAPGYDNVNDFLRDASKAFKLYKIPKYQRDELKSLVREADPGAADWIIKLGL